MGGLCRLSSQWLILAYSCPWWYVKYSVASLFLSFLWSWCRNVSGLRAPCLRAEPGPPLPVLHQKWNFTPNLKRAFCSLSRTGWAEGQQSFLGERHRAGGAPSASTECGCARTGELGLGKNTFRRALQKDTCCSSCVCFHACRRIAKIFQKLLRDWSLVLFFKGTCCMDRLAPHPREQKV